MSGGQAALADSIIGGAGLSATPHEDAGAAAVWIECLHGGWIVEGPPEVVAPQIHQEAALALSPRPDGTVWLFTPAHPGGRPSTVAAAERVVALVHRSRSPRQRSEILVSTLPADGRPGHLGVLNNGMFAGRWLFGVAPHSPRWPAEVQEVQADASADALLRSLGWDFASRVRVNQPKLLHDNETGAEMVVLAVAEGEHRDGPHADRVAASALSLAPGREPPALAAVAGGRVWRVFKPGDPRQCSVYVDTQAAGASYVHAILSPSGLASPEFAEWADRDSRRYASDLSSSLRRRIHGTAMPKLSEAAAHDMRRLDPGASLDTAFQAAVRILFRLLLIAWAEDEGILPYDRNDSYRRKSLTQQALRLANDPKLGAANGRGYSMFEDLKALWAVFDGGSAEMGVPAYNGGLFDNNTPIGQQIARLRLADSTVASVLRTLLTTDTDDDEPPGMADFSGMSVREFGTIYEELLEYRLSEAPQDLTADLTPADDAPGGDIEIAYLAGAPYLHDKSGQRKSTGSYFTKPFAVDHLLAEALHPALEEHLQRVADVLETEGDAAASEALWDFAVLDPASGSGHFLVAACDIIAEQFSKFQDNNSLQGVADALDRMRSAARTALEGRDPSAEAMITDRALLGRLAARKCLYAVDISEMATELCKVAMWVRTFVPGLPMYSLDHQIVSGNILLGVPSVDEAVDLLDPPKHREPGQGSLAAVAIRASLDRANTYETIARRLDETDHDEIKAASAARSDAGRALESARYLFDAALALRLGFLGTDRKGRIAETTDAESIVTMMRLQDETSGSAYAALRELDPHGRRPTHLPLMFPEVYRPDRPAGPGFDCVVGNPPWEKVIVDREAWWGLHIPGVRSDPVARRRARIDAHESSNPDLAEEFEADKQQAERLKKALRRAFPDLGSGHTDLYKAFCWANVAAVRAGGTVGMVLPRSAMSDAGMAKWRRRLFMNAGGGRDSSRSVPGDDHQPQGLGLRRGPQLLHGGPRRVAVSVLTCLNTRQWAFDGVDGRYTITLVTVRNPRHDPRGHL